MRGRIHGCSLKDRANAAGARKCGISPEQLCIVVGRDHAARTVNVVQAKGRWNIDQQRIDSAEAFLRNSQGAIPHVAMTAPKKNRRPGLRGTAIWLSD